MKKKDFNTIKSILGEDIFDTLQKYEIYKPNTKSVVDPEEIKVALQIVPRTILSYLFSHLKSLGIGEQTTLELPFAENASMLINKQGFDNYKGEINQNGQRISEFQHRPLPSIGLILLSTFELYDLSLLDEIKEDKEKSEKVERLQDVIDERLMLRNLVQDVVDRRMNERDAINKLINEKLNSHVHMVNIVAEEESPMEDNKKSKLKQFLENRESKRQETVELESSEIKCPDCGTAIHKTEGNIKLCVCYGEHMNKSIKYTKTVDGKVKFKFPKSFSIDNIEMLLDAIKEK